MERLGGRAIVLNAGSDAWAIEFRDGTVMDGKAGEHVKEAARVLDRYADVLAVRAFPTFSSWEEDRKDQMLRSFARYTSIPVINMESALFHPCQGLADALTVLERLEDPRGKRFLLTWTWHPKALPLSVTHSALFAAAHLGLEITLACPDTYDPDPEIMQRARELARSNGGNLAVVRDQTEGARGAHVVYAKSWTSIPCWSDHDRELRKRKEFRSWKVTEELMALTDNAFFLHCLPVRRNVVVTDGVLDGPASAVYDEAENRIWAQMAVLAAVLQPEIPTR